MCVLTGHGRVRTDERAVQTGRSRTISWSRISASLIHVAETAPFREVSCPKLASFRGAPSAAESPQSLILPSSDPDASKTRPGALSLPAV